MSASPTDEELLAYLDGELPDDAAYRRIEDQLQTDVALRRRLDEQVVCAERLRNAYRGKLQEPVPAHLIESVWQASWPQAHGAAVPAGGAAAARAQGRSGLALRLQQWLGYPIHGPWWAGSAVAALAGLAVAIALWPGHPAGEGTASTIARKDWALNGERPHDAHVITTLQAVPSGQPVAVGARTLEVLASFETPDGAQCRELQDTARQPGSQRVILALICRDPLSDWVVTHIERDTLSTESFQTASDELHAAMDRHIRGRADLRELLPAEESGLIARGWQR